MNETFVFSVDFNEEFQQMVANGHFNWVNGDMYDHKFKSDGVAEVEFEGKVFPFDKTVSLQKVTGLIKADDATNPWDVAAAEHLVFFGRKFPGEQRKRLIVALGAGCGHNSARSYLCLDADERGRILDLVGPDGGVDDVYYYLAVRRK